MGLPARPGTCWSIVAVVGDLGQEGRGSLVLRFRPLFLCLALLTLVVCALAGAAPALADRSMSTRFSANTNGNITFAANSLEVCPATAAGCTAARNTPPISSGTNNALNNNNYNMQYVNTAPGTVGGVATFDSSSATLSLPPGATVLFAGLYWGADTSAGSVIGPPTPRRTPRLAVRRHRSPEPELRRERRRTAASGSVELHDGDREHGQPG